MAQSLMATGLPSDRSFALAAQIEERSHHRPRRDGVEQLRALAEEVVSARGIRTGADPVSPVVEHAGPRAPLLVLLGGVTGVGKSTVATQLAGRLGFMHVIATDQVRQVVRAFFSHEFLPSVHYSSFDVARALSEPPRGRRGTVAGFLQQAHDIAPGVDAVVERASRIGRRWSSRACTSARHPEPATAGARRHGAGVARRARPEAHRRHFHTRGMQTLRSRSATSRRSTASACAGPSDRAGRGRRDPGDRGRWPGR